MAKLKQVMGATQVGRQGIGYGKEKRVWWSKASESEKTKLVTDEIRVQAKEQRIQTAVQQGKWTTWEDALQRSLSWNYIWHMTPLRLSFLIRAVYDQLPSGDNLKSGNYQTTRSALCVALFKLCNIFYQRVRKH